MYADPPLFPCSAITARASHLAEWIEAQGHDPAQLTYAQLVQRSASESPGGNWHRALDLFDGEPPAGRRALRETSLTPGAS